MMTIYVDLLFGLNTVINYLLLRGSAAMGGSSGGILRMLGAAALGGLYAVASVMPGLSALQGMFFQIVSAAGMLVAAFGWKKNTIKQGLYFFALSFAFGGAVLLAVQAVEPNCVLFGGRAYYAVTTPALLLLAGLCYGLAALVLRGWGTHTGGDIVPLVLELNGGCTIARALRDTGNTLRDPISGQCIPVASWQVLQRLLPEAFLEQQEFSDPVTLLQRLQKLYPDLRFRLVTYKAVGVSCGLLPAVRCILREGERKRRITVAFTGTALSAHDRFEALIGGAIT